MDVATMSRHVFKCQHPMSKITNLQKPSRWTFRRSYAWTNSPENERKSSKSSKQVKCLNSPANSEHVPQLLSAAAAEEDGQTSNHQTSQSASKLFGFAATKSAATSSGLRRCRSGTESAPSSRPPRSGRFWARQSAWWRLETAAGTPSLPKCRRQATIPTARRQWRTARPSTRSAIASVPLAAADWRTESTSPILSTGTAASSPNRKATASTSFESNHSPELPPNSSLRSPSPSSSSRLERATLNCSSASSQSLSRSLTWTTVEATCKRSGWTWDWATRLGAGSTVTACNSCRAGTRRASRSAFGTGKFLLDDAPRRDSPHNSSRGWTTSRRTFWARAHAARLENC